MVHATPHCFSITIYSGAISELKPFACYKMNLA